MADSTTNDSTMVSLGKFKVGGYAYWAPSGTALPTDSSTPLAAAFKLLGYLSEDGLTNATDTDTTEIKDANGTTVMKVITSYAESYQFALLEVLRVEAAKMRYNSDAVTGTDKSMTIKHQMPSAEDFVLVFEIAMSGNVKDRLVIGNGTRAEFGDRQVHAGDAQVYDVTVAANDMGNGVTAIEYIGRATAVSESAAVTEALLGKVVDPANGDENAETAEEVPAAE
ncbi:phage tail tube protein [Bifidobacterium longum subsp. infantis]|uniref:phage tail tube protein n=1 Tax=Bifidobacterium longum TaxID=216816 RepID=UPI004033F342